MTPAKLKQRLRTLIVVMMENRSFDHVLGHLSLPDYGGRQKVEGVSRLDDPDYGNPSENGTVLFPFVGRDNALPNDLPHERDYVTEQLAHSAALGGYGMTGFTLAYERFTDTTGVLQPPPLMVLPPEAVPVTSFLANEYAVCDHWFAPLPTSTQPNRLMAMSGYTLRDTTQSGLLPEQHLALDWLTAHHVSWRVYSAGLSFFTLMPKMWPVLIGEHFRSLDHLAADVMHEPDDTWPEVIFIEPDYDDSPVHLSGHACDNHPPLSIAFGEAFLRRVYEAVTSNADRWLGTAMFVTYDEHGGFFDHVAPPAIPCPTPAGASYAAFDSAGVRVPTIVASPLVKRGSVVKGVLDHTSILQLFAERFGQLGEPYSPSVEGRRQAGIGSASIVFSAGAARSDVPTVSSAPIAATTALVSRRDPSTPLQEAFATSVKAFAQAHGADALAKFPQIAHWLGRGGRRGAL